MRSISHIAIGLIVFLIGLAVTLAATGPAGSGTRYPFAYGALAGGLVLLIRGFLLSREEREEARVTLSKPSRLIRGEILSSDYPAEALDAGTEGRVELGYVVDENGQVCDVEIVRSSGSQILDEASKAILPQRYSYEPALNVLGEPITHYQTCAINWVLAPADEVEEADKPEFTEAGPGHSVRAPMLEDDLPGTTGGPEPRGYIQSSMKGDVWSEGRLRELYRAGWFSPSTLFYPTDPYVSYERVIPSDPRAFAYAARVLPPPEDFRDKYDHQYDMEGPFPAPDLSSVKGTFQGWVVLLGGARPLERLFPEETRARARK